MTGMMSTTSNAGMTEPHEVAAQLEAGTAEPFHVSRFPKGHQPTDFDRWATSTVRYEVAYEECYEPYVIGSRRLLPRYDERFRGYGMNKIQHLYACSQAGLRFVVEPGVFVAAAEHERSEAWRKMYGYMEDTPGSHAKPQRKHSDEHAVRVALLWGRFKEEIQSGHPPPLNAEHVILERRHTTAAAALPAPAPAQNLYHNKKKLNQKEIKDEARAQDLLSCVGRLVAV